MVSFWSIWPTPPMMLDVVCCYHFRRSFRISWVEFRVPSRSFWAYIALGSVTFSSIFLRGWCTQDDLKFSRELHLVRSALSRSSFGMNGLSSCKLEGSSILNVPVFRSRRSVWWRLWARAELDLWSFPQWSSMFPFDVDQFFSSLYFSLVVLKSRS